MLGNLISIIAQPPKPSAPVQPAPVVTPVQAAEKEKEPVAEQAPAPVTTPIQTASPATQAAVTELAQPVQPQPAPTNSVAPTQPAAPKPSALTTDERDTVEDTVAAPVAVEEDALVDDIAEARRRALATQESVKLENMLKSIAEPTKSDHLNAFATEKPDENESFGGYSRKNAERTLAV